MTDQIPSASEIEDALQKVLASTIFSRSERARHLLAHLVAKEQAGEVNQLKGFCLAIDVFGRGPDFDPSLDAVVRVQMGRLRDLIVQYYADEGRTDPVQIVLSRGTYVPSYRINTATWVSASRSDTMLPPSVEEISAARVEKDEIAPSFHASEKGARFSRRSVFALASLFLLMVGAAIALSPGLRTPDETGPVIAKTDSSSEPAAFEYGLDDLPTVILIAPDANASVQSVALTMRRAISSFDTLTFHQMNGGEPTRRPMDFHIRLLNFPQQKEVLAELAYGHSGEVLFTRGFAYALNEEELNDRVASMLTEAGPVTGAIYTFLENRNLVSGVPHCMTLNDDFYQSPNQKSFDAAYQCLNDALENGSRSPLILAELSALIAKSVTDGYAKDDKRNFDDAVTMARRAVLRGPTSPYAHRAYGFVHAMLGQHDISEFWMKRAYELNTFDLSMAAAYAYSLTNGGKYAEGKALMERSLIYSSAHPTWWEYSYFIGAFMTGEWTDAYNVSQLMRTSDRPRHIAAVLIMAHRVGDIKMVEHYLRKLKAAEPRAVDNPEILYMPNDTRREAALLVQALREAVLGQVTQSAH